MTKAVSVRSYICVLALMDYELYNVRPFTNLVFITTPINQSVK